MATEDRPVDQTPVQAPTVFQYRLLTDDDREEALLIKAKALEQEHYALSNGFTLHGVAGAPLPGEDPQNNPADQEKQLARFREHRKAAIEKQLQEEIHPKVDSLREKAKANGRTLMGEARVRDAARTANRAPVR